MLAASRILKLPPITVLSRQWVVLAPEWKLTKIKMSTVALAKEVISCTNVLKPVAWNYLNLFLLILSELCLKLQG